MKTIVFRIGTCLLTFIICQITLKGQIMDAQISGDFYTTSQFYVEDATIGAEKLPGGKDIGLNGAFSLNYTWKNVRAGVRYERYMPPLLGFESPLEGDGISYRFISYSHKNFEVTLGNFYEQFGSGMSLRSYYEPQLGLDNSIDGFRLKYSPKGLDIKLLTGRNRKYFDKDDSRIYAADLEVHLDQFLKSLEEKNISVDIGVSLVSKDEDNTTGLDIPVATTLFTTRTDLRIKGFTLGWEYGEKGIEPQSLNRFSNRKGKALFLSTGYSTKGFGVNVYWKYIDNMFFRSDRESLSNVTSTINYLPPNSNVNTYRLTTLYPYATQGNGENGINIDLFFNIKKGTALGGKYGTKVATDFSYVTALSKPIPNGPNVEVEPQFLSFSDSVYYTNWNVEVTKRVNKELRYTAGWSFIKYNREVIEGIPGTGFVNSWIIFTDITYRMPKRRFIRTELQHLSTKQHTGNWLFGLVEFGWSSKLSSYISDEWNYDNSIHYYSLGFTYRKGASLIGLSYVRERSGLICVGGICRFVPASNGIRLSVNTSF